MGLSKLIDSGYWYPLAVLWSTTAPTTPPNTIFPTIAALGLELMLHLVVPRSPRHEIFNDSLLFSTYRISGVRKDHCPLSFDTVQYVGSSLSLQLTVSTILCLSPVNIDAQPLNPTITNAKNIDLSTRFSCWILRNLFQQLLSIFWSAPLWIPYSFID